MNFVAIDVETANSDVASICQIGVVVYENGNLHREWKTYVNPEDTFNPSNVRIHGIDRSVVENAPTFPEVVDTLRWYLDDNIVVCHTHFDRVALDKAIKRYNLGKLNCIWLDSAKVVRRTWKQYSRKGYGLKKVCDFLNYEFKHHDALEDAKAAAYILVTASKELRLDVKGWLKRVSEPINPKVKQISQAIKTKTNVIEALHGARVVFTGNFGMSSGQVNEIVTKVGCQVANKVTDNTTLLVIGDKGSENLAKNEKSFKYRKAEQFIKQGVPIKIIAEKDFKKLLETADA